MTSCCNNKRLFYADEHQSLESQSLLSSFSQNKPISRQKVAVMYNHLTEFCPMSKAAVLVLSWTVFVGVLHFMLSNIAFVLLVYDEILPFELPSAIVIFYASFALVYMFYPLSGCFADVYCGRFKTITGSLALLLFILVFYVTFYGLCLLLRLSNFWMIFLGSAGLVCTLITVIGVAGYGANFIQFGLDQLLEAPSQHQAHFVHWAKWCSDLMSAIIILIIVYLNLCSEMHFTQQLISISSLFFLFELVLTVLLIIGCWKQHWFYSEPAGRRNPYKTVIKVLNFARKYSYPLQRSAFTYCDDEKPSRLDFAKERFGGPFTTEQVEDVKTFFRIVMVLLALGPIFILDAPTSAAIMAFVGAHLGPPNTAWCKWSWMVVNTGVLRYIISTLFLPVYSWIVFTLLHKRVPKIFWRLGVGIFLYLFGGLSMFIVDIIGHYQYQGSDAQCIVTFDFSNSTSSLASDSNFAEVSTLDMHWAVFIPSNVLIGIGPTLVTVTIFEFISAQSPHSMKGLLLGTYYAITGVYQFISSVAMVPFLSYDFQNYGQRPPHTGCIFGYSLFVCLTAMIGFVLFIVVARLYRYREREDRPYDQRFVIDIYNRYLNGVRDYGLCSDSESQ